MHFPATSFSTAEPDSDGFDTYRRFSSGQISPETLPGALLCRTVLHLVKLSVFGKNRRKWGRAVTGIQLFYEQIIEFIYDGRKVYIT